MQAGELYNGYMETVQEKNEVVVEHKHHHHGGCHGAGSGVYGLGVIGAAIYYLGLAQSFWTGVLGILKALVWPAMLVYELLKFLHVQ